MSRSCGWCATWTVQAGSVGERRPSPCALMRVCTNACSAMSVPCSCSLVQVATRRISRHTIRNLQQSEQRSADSPWGQGSRMGGGASQSSQAEPEVGGAQHSSHGPKGVCGAGFGEPFLEPKSILLFFSKIPFKNNSLEIRKTMTTRCQKRPRNHRCFNLFEKGDFRQL